MTQLPSMASLVAFQHAARTLSFKRAATELGLSPSALSRQIQALEEQLGVQLFVRNNPGLELTAHGAHYLAVVDACLAELQRAQERVAAERPPPLRVSALPSFTETCLIPNLPDLERTHPELELEIEATVRYADFKRDPVDVAIRFGKGPWEGLHSEPILDLICYPVCSPALLAADPPLRVPADLAEHTLIHLTQIPDAWAIWLRKAGCPELEPRRGLRFDHMGLAMSAAENGMGIALPTHVLCAKRISEGKLCKPFDLSFSSQETYHFVCRPEGLADPRITSLRDWLVDRFDE